MPLYENVYIARPDISAAQVEALTESLTAIVAENGGAVKKNEYWGLKNLAYRIKKNRKGHYSLLNIDAPAAAIHELERNMRINEDILRYLTIRVDELDENPSVMMQTRSSRDDRGRPGRGGFGDRDRRPPPSSASSSASSSDSKPDDKSSDSKPDDKAPTEKAEAAPAAKGDDK